MQELWKFNRKINVIPKELEKYRSFSTNNKSIFIDRLQFWSYSLDSFVKNLNKDDFKHLSQEFDSNVSDQISKLILSLWVNEWFWKV